MNPKMTITVDDHGKAYVSTEGLVSVGAKVDVEVRGLCPQCVPDWGTSAAYAGKSLRFRVVATTGEDLVLFPLKTKAQGGGVGDMWTVSSEAFFAYDVDFNTSVLREKMTGVPYNEGMQAGVILDSTADAAQYGVGSLYVRQWQQASTDVPTVVPDWTANLARKPTTAALGTDVDMDAVVTKVNTLISQLKGENA